MKTAKQQVNSQIATIHHELSALPWSSQMVLIVNWADYIQRFDDAVIKSLIVRLHRQDSERERYLGYVAKAIMEHEWLRDSMNTLTGFVNEPAPPVVEPTVQYVDRSSSTIPGEPTPSGNEARLAANSAALDGFDAA